MWIFCSLMLRVRSDGDLPKRNKSGLNVDVFWMGKVGCDCPTSGCGMVPRSLSLLHFSSLPSAETINDGQFHTVELVTFERMVNLSIDGGDPMTMDGFGKAHTLNSEAPLYVGGRAVTWAQSGWRREGMFLLTWEGLLSFMLSILALGGHYLG